MDNLKNFGYKISYDADFLDKQNAMTPSLKQKLQILHEEAGKGKRSSINKFYRYIKKYPKNPQLKNYLSVLYLNMGNIEKSQEVNHWILTEHPDYLYGKLNLAFEYYAKEEFDKMPEVLGKGIELKSLYPDRDTFHISEVINMLKAAVFYYGAVGNLEEAEKRLKIMKDLEPDSIDTEQAEEQLMADKLTRAHERFLKEQESRITVNVIKTESNQKTAPPVFTHKEIESLYKNGFDIDEDILRTILDLPRETMISDLEMILTDSIERFDHFSGLEEDNKIEFRELDFVLHALFLLGESGSYESIDSVLNILRQDEEYYDLYFGDLLTEIVWEPVYKLAHNKLDILKAFMYEPGIYTYAKSVITDVIEQLEFHDNRREEVKEWYKDVLEFYSNSSLDDNIIDSDVIAFVISGVADLHLKELLPVIKELFEKRIVSTGICGDFKEIERDILKPFKPKPYQRRELLTIFERYEELNNFFSDDINNSGFPYENDEYEYSKQEPIVKEKKIGRNEPCPCGSGKKYKKCCMRK